MNGVNNYSLENLEKISANKEIQESFTLKPKEMIRNIRLDIELDISKKNTHEQEILVLEKENFQNYKVCIRDKILDLDKKITDRLIKLNKNEETPQKTINIQKKNSNLESIVEENSICESLDLGTLTDRDSKNKDNKEVSFGNIELRENIDYIYEYDEKIKNLDTIENSVVDFQEFLTLNDKKETNKRFSLDLNTASSLNAEIKKIKTLEKIRSLTNHYSSI